MRSLSDYSLRDRETMECPYQFYATMRREQPVHRDPATGFFIVSRYADVLEVLRHPSIYSSAMDRMAIHSTGADEEVMRIYMTRGFTPLSTLDSDPPTHTQYRELVRDAFSAQRVQSLTVHMTEIAENIVDQFVAGGACEFVSQFARPFPLTVMADILGVPRSDQASFKAWSDAMIDVYGMMISREREIECAEQGVEMQQYLAARLKERTLEPKDDILSDLVRARYGGDRPLSMEEMLSYANVLLVAGNHTTSNALSNSLYLLLQHPEAIAKLREDDAQIRSFIEEALRFESPVQGEIRVVTKDTVLAGTAIPKGSVVNFRVASANRDEERYPDSAAFDMGRKNVNTHLAFGAGIHHCLGAQLARQELFVAFSVLLRRLKNIQLAPGRNDFKHTPNAFLRGLEELHITFERP